MSGCLLQHPAASPAVGAELGAAGQRQRQRQGRRCPHVPLRVPSARGVHTLSSAIRGGALCRAPASCLFPQSGCPWVEGGLAAPRCWANSFGSPLWTPRPVEESSLVLFHILLPGQPCLLSFKVHPAAAATAHSRPLHLTEVATLPACLSAVFLARSAGAPALVCGWTYPSPLPAEGHPRLLGLQPPAGPAPCQPPPPWASCPHGWAAGGSARSSTCPSWPAWDAGSPPNHFWTDSFWGSPFWLWSDYPLMPGRTLVSVQRTHAPVCPQRSQLCPPGLSAHVCAVAARPARPPGLGSCGLRAACEQRPGTGTMDTACSQSSARDAP